METIERFEIPNSLDRHNLLAEISKSFSITEEPPFIKMQTFYDTFDWRLYNKGLLLIREKNNYHIQQLKDEEILETVFCKSQQGLKFWWEFPDGQLKSLLKSLLDVRALIPLAEVEKDVLMLRNLNEDEKTVAKIQFENLFLLHNAQKIAVINTIKLKPIRGYRSEFSQLSRFIKTLGISQTADHDFHLALKASGKKPGDYSSKLRLKLSPDMTARQATTIILRFLLQVIKQNETGIKADIDTEFLHDFRVAIRRTRSALTQIKSVFPKEIKNHFKQDFSKLGKLTNRMRDLDVYLLKQDRYRDMLPEYLRTGLEPLFSELIEERDKELTKLVKTLGSDSYKKTINTWEDFLNSSENDDYVETKHSHKPVIVLAKKFIYKAYNRVIEIGIKINDDTPDSELHQLRIECKKLRYLLEFFTSLFPAKEMRILIKQLKKLQDNLGDFNDFSVQQENLKTYLEEVKADSEESRKIVAAIGGLISILYQKQRNVRNAFAETFSEFSSDENAELFQTLFM